MGLPPISRGVGVVIEGVCLTSPATKVALDDKSRAASPAALVASDGETPKRNWLLTAKGLLSTNINEH